MSREAKHKVTGPEADQKPVGRSTVRQKEDKSKVARNVSDVITGDILTNQRLRRWYPLILWCILLVFVYIGVHFKYQRLQRIEIQERILLNEERSRAVIFSSMRMNASRHSRIVDEVQRRGLPLEESTVPPKIIEKD